MRVTCHGETEEWTLRVQETDIRMAVQEIDLWNNTATVTAFLTEEEAKKAEVQYRSEGAERRQTARKEGYDDGILRAIVEPGWQESQNKNGLTVYTMAPEQGIFAGHTYELRLLVGDEEYGMITQTTAAGHTIPDGDLEDGTLSLFHERQRDRGAGALLGQRQQSLQAQTVYAGRVRRFEMRIPARLRRRWASSPRATSSRVCSTTRA